MIAVAGVMLLLPTQETAGESVTKIGIVNVDRLNMRPGPGTDRPPIKTLEKGTTVTILEKIDGWLKVTHEGRVGYIRNRADYVYVINETQMEAENKSGGTVERLKQKAEDIGRKIDESGKEVEEFLKKESALITDIDKTDLRLHNTRKRIAVLKSELSALEKKMEASSAELKRLKNKIHADDIYISNRLIALYKLSWLGRMQAFASAETIYDLFQQNMSLQRILSYDEKIRSEHLSTKAGFQNLINQLNSQKDEKHAVEADLKKQIENLSKSRKKRLDLLAAIQSRKSLELAFIKSLKEAETALNQKMADLNKKEPENIKAAGNIFEISFPSLKGLLPMPVKGKIVGRFGPYKNVKFNIVNFRSGIDIQADMGEPIRAVCTGRVIYSNWFRGYGNMMIIDHGDNYHTVYAHMEESFKKEGDTVKTGEVVATVGDTGSMIGPSLYFEVRHHGKPLDPIQWIIKG